MSLHDDARAVTLPWSQLPISGVPSGMCAALICNSERDPRLYVNDQVECDHDHLADDANALIDSFNSGDRDDGWGDLGMGDFGTFIGTQDAADATGADAWPAQPNN